VLALAVAPAAHAKFDYSIRYPMDWSARAGAGPGKPDRLAPASSSGPLPMLTVVAQKVPAGTTEGVWSSVVNSRPEVSCAPTYYVREPIAGVPGMLTHYPGCNGADEQWASFVHQGRGYTLRWRGKPGRLRIDGPRFRVLLRSIALTP
jgi:hypothetical protein